MKVYVIIGETEDEKENVSFHLSRETAEKNLENYNFFLSRREKFWKDCAAASKKWTDDNPMPLDNSKIDSWMEKFKKSAENYYDVDYSMTECNIFNELCNSYSIEEYDLKE